MRIGIEVQRIFRKNKHGIDRVGIELIKQLQKIDTQNEYFIFTRSGPDSTVIKETSNFKIILLPSVSYPIWEQYLLPKAVKKYGCDVLHATSNTAPIFLKTPIILTLHDIIYLEKKILDIFLIHGTYYHKVGNMYRKFIVPLIINKCKNIITVSNFEKIKILEYFRFLKPDLISIAYNGVSEHFKPVKCNIIKKNIILKYNLPDDFFFFIGGNDPRKNTKNTLIAFAHFIKENPINIKLVILHHTKNELVKMLKEIKEQGLIHHILSVGYVSEKDLPVFYSLSSLFLYPSKREGFGIPIIEAMACGTPVITSFSSSMPEVTKNAAHLIDPENPLDIALAMNKIYKDRIYKDFLVKKGLSRSMLFTWDKMAYKLLDMYLGFK